MHPRSQLLGVLRRLRSAEMTELLDLQIIFGNCRVCRICAMREVDLLGVGFQLSALFVASIVFRRPSRR